MNSRQAIHVLFLEPIRSDHFVNRLTGMVGKLLHGRAACHVEICIPDAGQRLIQQNCTFFHVEAELIYSFLTQVATSAAPFTMARRFHSLLQNDSQTQVVSPSPDWHLLLYTNQNVQPPQITRYIH